MKKQTGGDAAIGADDAVVDVIDESAPKGDQHFDPAHEWPTAGGSYVRQGDGSLKLED